VSAAGSTNLEHYLLFHANFTVIDAQNSLQARLVEKVPSLEEGDWKTFPDGRMEVTWRLRPDIRWHDGTPLVAEDFAFGMKVINDPELTVTRNAGWRLISEIQTPDPRTLVFVWKEPSILGNANGPDGIPALPQHRLAGLYQAGDKQAFENSPYWTTEFVGLGPYRLGQWQLGSFIEALAFEGYALGRPRIDRLILYYVGDVNAVIAGLLSGDLDIAPYGALLDADQVSTLRNAWGDRGESVVMEKGVRSFWLQHRDPSAPWMRDGKVRQALVHALDRPTLSATLQDSLAKSADILLYPEDAAYRIVQEQGFPRYSHDLARAQQLLADAGWNPGPDRVVRSASGQTLDVEMRATAQGDNVKEMEAVAAFFSAAGLRPILSPIPAQADNKDELKNTSKGGLFWPYNFSMTAGQSLTTVQVASEATRWRGSNYSGFSNAGYNRLYGQFETTLDPGQRQQVLAQIARFVAEEIPLIPIYYNIQAVTVRKGVTGPGKASPMQAASAWNIHTWELKG
jgi:peptide/nickel transport system substrate-binding protein